MTAITSNADALYKAVKGLGLTRAQARRLLPSWWSPEIEKQPDGIAELAMHLGRRLSLDVGALLSGQLRPNGAVTNIAFKHRAGTDASSLAASSFIAASLAHTILAAMGSKYCGLPSTADELRTAIRKAGSGNVSFGALVDLCWLRGIPVIPLPNLPVGIRKMDGAALQDDGRPAIVIAKRKSSRAWLSFIVAHEIAHIALGHLKPGSSIVDVSLRDMATYATESDQDRQEAEADKFALEILGGREADATLTTWSSRMSAVEIAASARGAGQKLGVEPGHLVLRFAFKTRHWAECITALGFLTEDLDAEEELIRKLRSHIDMDLVAEDLQDMVMQITGYDIED
jgi:hypothetical protein